MKIKLFDLVTAKEKVWESTTKVMAVNYGTPVYESIEVTHYYLGVVFTLEEHGLYFLRIIEPGTLRNAEGCNIPIGYFLGMYCQPKQIVNVLYHNYYEPNELFNLREENEQLRKERDNLIKRWYAMAKNLQLVFTEYKNYLT